MFDGKTVEVEFKLVNAIEKQLYHVYIPVNNLLYRVHMQKREDGSF